MTEQALLELAKSIPGEALVLLFALWLVGNLSFKGYGLWVASRQRGAMVRAVKEAPCNYPQDLAEQARLAIALQQRIASEQAKALERTGADIRDLVAAINQRDTRQADTLQALSNSLAVLATEIRVLATRPGRRS